MTSTLSQHPRPDFGVLHVSDTHLLGRGKKLHNFIDTEARIEQMFQRLVSSEIPVRALVFTGDLADRAEPEAYQQLKDLIEPHANTLGAQIIWVMGNHDQREPFSEVLWGQQTDGAALDRVYDVEGLRIIALDSSVPGYHHGSLEPEQLTWLVEHLEEPAPRGTLLALHHPPIPTLIDLMGLIELESQQSLWSAIDGSDVRGILAGHLHYSTHTVKQGIAVSVAAAMCYTIDVSAPPDRALVQVDRAHASSLVSVYPDQLVFSEIPAVEMPEIVSHSAEMVPSIHQMSLRERRELFSRKDSEFNRQVDRGQLGNEG